MLIHFFFILILGGLATPFSISSKLQDLQNAGGGRMISWEPRTMISSEDYPCQAEGLYDHPTNCSRFYRCVDFTKESRIFSRYLFECPGGMVFAKTIQACVPGVCPEKAAKLPSPDEKEVDGEDSGSASVSVGPVQPGAAGIAGGMTETPEEQEGAADIEEGESAGGSESPEDPKMPGSMESAIAPVEGSSGDSKPSGLPPVIDQDTSVVSPAEVPESMENCPGKYVQHAKYCNLFHLCDDPNNLFSCYEGTAFSSARQMCRLYQFEEALCKGKEVFVPTAELFREAFQWDEVGVVPLDKNPVYNSNPYVFTNIGELPEGFTQPKFQAPSPPSRIPLAPTPLEDINAKKKSKFSSILGSFSSLLSDSARRRPSIRKSTTRKTSAPKISKKDKPETNQKEPGFNFQDFDISAIFPYASLLSSSLSGLASSLESSQPESVSVNPLSSLGFINPITSSGGSYSPLKSFGQAQSQFPGQGYQLGYAISPSSFAYSPYSVYSGIFPYSFGSSDASSLLRAQLSSPTRGYNQYQGVPFASSGSYYPYSPYFSSPSSSSSFGYLPSPYAFAYDPSRNSISPISIPSSYLSSLYGSLLGLNPYDSLLQMDDQQQQPEDQSFLSEIKPEKGTSRLKVTEPEKPSFQSELAKRYPFLFGNTDASRSPAISSAFEARNKDGDTYQVIPLSPDEVASLASQGLLERAVTVGKDFSYDDLKNLNKGEIILATFPKK